MMAKNHKSDQQEKTSPEAAMTLYASKGPYEAIFAANFGVYQSVTIIGHIPEDSNGLTVNLIKSKTCEIYHHLRIRLDENRTVRNSYLNGSWGIENWDTPVTGFERGKDFMMEIKNEGAGVSVYGNGIFSFSFNHRKPFNEIDTVQLSGDCKFYSLQF
ncbi:galectin-4-like [Dendropsophus ebraccatus]|uniref:galectin-4-like n=1 Tax=Dendropsophus ebraccatus TaxID=150705 RepID=UPI003831A1C1